MSNVKIETQEPVPFFSHFLEGQFSRNLTAAEMQAIRGGAVVTMVAPSDQEGMPVGELPDFLGMLRHMGWPMGQMPGNNPSSPVTMAYPSDGESASI
ncbi:MULTISPECIES: microviridin/marinostatin family tricyclic proteinase inhibitor [Paraburkholderia]|uniref:microviridin/marinostatin family tricyclic proteinase inhibitor n=1 Tax=Paraburkholderia TaxID=1822464 RepID=UPI0004B71EAE|nr:MULTISPECIES: microviridin/marinostatin family tricyclic proteinase inhibitor [Paraburkholderia]MCP3716915.1 microviridin/marinostatin family tricyclic proteinase inhibitor [Paraburkholderia sp. CNPSo 3281]